MNLAKYRRQIPSFSINFLKSCLGTLGTRYKKEPVERRKGEREKGGMKTRTNTAQKKREREERARRRSGDEERT
jgi:hypothetical protein